MKSGNPEFHREGPTNPPLIHLQNVDVVLNGKQILSQINWRLNAGENWAFIGGNGAGKTTLVRLIRGELWPAPNHGGKRIYCLNGEEQTAPLGVREKIPVVSADLQDDYTRYRWNLTCEEVIHTGFFNSVWLFHKPTPTQRETTDRLMESLSVAHLRDRSFLELSRGEARKILIARALVIQPPILILDEFGNGLDILTRHSLFDFMEQIVQNGTQIISITHRLDEWIPSVSHALLMDRGRIAKQGEKEEVLHSDAMKRLYPKKGDIAPFAGNRSSTPCRKIHKIDGQRVLLTIHNADVFRKNQLVLHQIKWRMMDDENWAILGKNSSGKSSFLSLIYGALPPALGGTIHHFDLPDAETSVWEIRKRMGFLSAHLQADYEYNLTGEEVVQTGFFSSVGLWDIVSEERKQAASRWIEFFHLQGLAEQPIHTMSYGELRKILLARALVNDPEILLLDEPCDGLDRASKTEFLRLLESLTQTPTRLIFVTHHPEELISSITHALILDEGRITAQGMINDILSQLPFFRR